MHVAKIPLQVMRLEKSFPFSGFVQNIGVVCFKFSLFYSDETIFSLSIAINGFFENVTLRIR